MAGATHLSRCRGRPMAGATYPSRCRGQPMAGATHPSRHRELPLAGATHPSRRRGRALAGATHPSRHFGPLGDGARAFRSRKNHKNPRHGACGFRRTPRNRGATPRRFRRALFLVAKSIGGFRRARDRGERVLAEIGERVIAGNDPSPKSASPVYTVSRSRRNRRAHVPAEQSRAEIGERIFPGIKASPKSARLCSRASRLRRNRRGFVPAHQGFAEIGEAAFPRLGFLLRSILDSAWRAEVFAAAEEYFVDAAGQIFADGLQGITLFEIAAGPGRQLFAAFRVVYQLLQ